MSYINVTIELLVATFGWIASADIGKIQYAPKISQFKGQASIVTK